MDTNVYRREIEAWHAARVERLQRPDGWLSLVGLAWLQPGVNRVGSAGDNDIVLVKAPAHLGTLVWHADGTLELDCIDRAGVTVDGAAAAAVRLRDDRDGAASVVAFGTVSFIVIDRSGRKALRVRDTEAPTRTGFAGIERFPVDPAWRIVAEWLPLDPPYRLTTGTVVGTVEAYPAPGKAVFEHAGQRFGVYPVFETPNARELFLMFGDATSGRQTHGAARFLYVDPPRDGKVVLDFNRAYNPPCAFTDYATCPLAPPENKLALAVTAGELKYRAHA
ncbi:MAG TPA: DUF1684 domain-containing protein [Rhodanobacteraceae bacterium]|nr:DUF1684 domain-containing protein [Rhodanobacteraceae bacterium]